MKLIKKYTFAVVFILCFNAACAYAAQSTEEIEGLPIRSFYDDFESYETTMLDTPSQPDGYAFKNRVTNAYGGTQNIIYSANAADNIPIFNDNLISDTLNLYQNESSDSVTISGVVDSEYIGDKVTLLITYKDFIPDSPEAEKIKYIKETVVKSNGKYEFEIKWPDEYGQIGDYIVTVYAEGVTDILDNMGHYIKPIVVYNPSAPGFQSETLGNNVYKAEGPDGNMLYGGLEGYYGWYGGGLFENYPDPYESGFVVEAESRAVLGHNENRLAVINEVKGDNTSNKLLIMDALYLKGNKETSGGGHSQTAVFGKHNLDFSGNTEIKFRLYPYQVGGSAQGFKMFLTRGEYDMSFEPASVYDYETGLSYEYHSPEFYKGSYFAPNNKYELLRLSSSDLTNGGGVHMFKVAGAENRVTGYEFIASPNTPPTTNTKTTEAEATKNLPADKYYDIRIDIDRYDSSARLYFEVKDNNGELVYSTAPNGIGWGVPDLAEFLSNPDEKFGIVFEAHSSAWVGADERTKVGIDNLEFSKKDYIVRNAWLSSQDGVGTINFDVYNYTDGDITACVYAAIYDNEQKRIEKVLTKSVAVSAQSGPAEDLFIDKIVLPESFNADKNSVKLFVLSDNKSLKPLLKEVEIFELF